MQAVDEVSGLLELKREEEGRRDVDALDLAALRVRAARLYLVSPEGEARSIGLAVEEVPVVLRDEEGRRVYGVDDGGRRVVFDYVDGRDVRRADVDAVAARQRDLEEALAFEQV